MSEELSQEIIAHARGGTLLDAIFTKYDHPHRAERDRVATTLAELHNSGAIDVLDIISFESMQPYTGRSFSRGRAIYRSLVPSLISSAETIISKLSILIDSEESNNVAVLSSYDFEKWCDNDCTRPIDVLKLVDTDFPNADRFLTFAITAGIRSDRALFIERALQFILSEHQSRKLSAIKALAFVVDFDQAEWNSWTEALYDASRRKQSTDIYCEIIRTIFIQLSTITIYSTDTLIDILIPIIKKDHPVILCTTAQMTGIGRHAIPERLLIEILDVFRKVPADDLTAIELVDFALSELIGRGAVGQVQDVVAELIRKPTSRVTADKFDACWYALNRIGGEVLEDWIISWLLDGDMNLCGAVSNHILSDRVTEYDINFRRHNLRSKDYSYLARKIVGFFFANSELMHSLLMSILRDAPPSETDTIVDLLIDPVLINYSGLADRYLALNASDDGDTSRPHVQRALEKLEEYLAGLRSIGRVVELHPSQNEQSIERQRHSDSMAEAMNNNSDDFPLSKIFNESVILHGTRTVNWIDRHGSESIRTEITLNTVTHSIELPRGELVDPIGTRLELIHFRAESRPL
ncbi:hypothetical protein SAMN02745172_02445 [Pseudoxanthobacter soli DSM 19599]|uniref:Uncharacterized protein n=1 Tax=Pseudoxanthobacter soli DSM 19599 TaxID=1123029 RepID=A0A1M7ZLM1_9HYPH|nr:hypothetical protein [Pseudoxanthobacter soli]SHO65798.1 hypothetical protein SAMN02745172_02445 [Pseudoxanthobacter soli DSM 19599]